MKKNRIIALLLAVVLCIGMLPLSALAEEPMSPTESTVVSQPEGGETIVAPTEEPEDSSQPPEEIAAALEDTPDSGEEEAPAIDPEESDPVLAFDGVPVVREGAAAPVRRGLLKAAGVGQSATLRVLYYVFKEDVGNTDSFGLVEQLPAKAVLADGVYKAAYCLDSELMASNGVSYTWDTMDWAHKRLVGDVLALGFQYQGSSGWSAEGAENYKWAVCQLLIWAIQNGKITRDTNGVPTFPAQVDADMQTAANHSYNSSGMMAYYNSLKADLIKLRKIPSFAGRTASTAPAIKLSWNGSAYSATVTDNNGVLSRYSFSIPGVTLSANGNSLSITASGSSAGEQTSAPATYAPHIGEGAVAVWKTADSSYQKFAVYDGGGEVDPIPAYLKISFDAVGGAGLRKTSEDGIVSGVSFEITGTDGSSVTKTTDGDGQISLDGLPIYQDGEKITYTAREVDVPARYVTPSTQTFQLSEGQDVSISFENRLKKWKITVTKTDRETGTAQGDASLGGAVYGIYKDGVLQDSYTTDASGKFTSKEYPCGTGWTLKEISPSEGYLLNVGTESIGMSPVATTVEHNSTTKSVQEQVIKGKIAITKHTDDGSTQIETPERGAQFQIYLASAGSFANAKATERDTLTCNEAGYAESKLLPYGRYTVHQTKGWDGAEFMPDFQVTIDQDGKVYPFIINNAVFKAFIQIVKKDAETGRVIPASGVGFKIKDTASGKWITQHIHYPTPMDLDTYYTDTTGRLMLPEPLGFGTYQLYEQQSAFGYTLNGEPVTFKVDGTAKTVTVEMGNTAQKARLTLKKTGEVFASVTRQGGKYQPVYELTGLSGAVYALYADEDIRTGDGTKFYSAGELVDRVETQEDGVAIFPVVHLGKYKVVEVTAPSGYVLDPTEYRVEFTYENQEVALVTSTLECQDQRQKLDLSLRKSMEEDSTFGLGKKDEYQSVRFGLFAAKDLTAKDGKVIPKDGLLEEIGIDAQGKGIFTSDLPFGSYYVQELASEEHYRLSDAKYPVAFSYQGQQKSTVPIVLQDGEEIVNELIRGKVAGQKKDDDGKALAGAVFGLFPGDSTSFDGSKAILTATSDSQGRFTFDRVPFGKYQVREITAPYGYVADTKTYPVTIGEHGQVLEIASVNKAQKGIVKLSKEGEVFSSVTQEEGRYVPHYEVKGLAGAVYQIIAAEDIYTYNHTLKAHKDEVVDTITTGADGKAQSKELYLGNYTVQEAKAPYGMVLNAVPQAAALTYAGQTVEVTETSVGFTNDRQKLAIDLRKSVELDNLFEIGRNGEAEKVAFSLFAAEDIVALDGTKLPKDGLVDVIVLSDLAEKDGKIHGSASFTADLPLGTYYVRETRLDEHYLPALDYDVTFTYEDQTVAMVALSVNEGQEIENEIIRGRVQGKKLDDDGKPLAGALFGLFTGAATDFSKENAKLTATSDADGSFAFEGVPYGSYLIKEISAPFGYVLPTDVFPVTIREEGQEITVEGVNRAQLGIIKVYKEGEVFASVAEKDGVYTPVYEVTGLPGAVYEITAAEDIATPNGTPKYAKGEVVDTLTTDNTGHAESKPLYLGKYTVTEVKAPHGMVLHEVPNAVELTYAGQLVQITETSTSFTDVRQKLALDLVKSVEIDDRYKLGRNGEAQQVTFGLFAAEDIPAKDGKALPKDGLLETVTLTDVQEEDGRWVGKATFAADLPLGSYYVKETGFDFHYLPAQEFPVEFVYGDQTVKVVNLHLNEGEAIANDLIRGSLRGQKNGEDGKGLEGVTFGLFFADAKEFQKEDAILSVQTGKDGAFEITDIPLGKYLLAEVETLPGYVPLADPIPVEITEDGQEINLGSVVNEHTKVQISKQDFTTGKELPGAKLELRDQDGKVVESWTSTDKPHLIERLPVGKYTLREITTPAGYDVAEEVIFEVKPTGEIQQVIMKDKPTPKIPNTGDERKMVAAGLVLAASLTGAVCLFVLRRRRKK